MKRIVVFVLSLLLLVPCGAVVGPGNREAKSKEQKYAEKKTKDTFRAWSRYHGFASMDLEGFAAAAARKNLALRVEVYITTMVENYQDAVGSDMINARQKAVAGGENQQRSSGNFKQVADALIRNSWVVMTDRYVQKDGTVVCFAAVEVDIDDIEAVIKTSAAIKEAFNAAGINVNSPEFQTASSNTRQKYAEGKVDLSRKLDISDL